MFVQEEILDEGNMYKCEKCNILRKCKKKLSIFRFPEILVVHMKRFRYNNINAREKINTDVNFPLHGLDLTPFLSKDRNTNNNSNNEPSIDNPPIYDLVGVSNHTGGISGGHYIAHVNTNSNKSNEASRWVCFNDERVDVVNEASLIGPSAYVLFYKLRK
jgi:ubiquitin C-terminal hydrolase